jgi:hypothetical protein
MKWWWSLVLCTGCLQPNPSFKPGSTSGGSDTASEEDTLSDIGTSPTLDTADDEVDDMDDEAASLDTAEGSSDGTTGATSPTTTDPSTTQDPVTDDGSDSVSTTGAPLEHTIFISGADVAGDFGGLAGADALCNDLATSAGLGGTWRAILSDSTTDARDHIVIGGPIRNVMGDLIAEDHADLWDGFIGAPVQYTEVGKSFLAAPFTGTQADGTFSGANCNDWTTAGGSNSTVGDAGYAGSTWIEAGTTSCGGSSPVYCISQ